MSSDFTVVDLGLSPVHTTSTPARWQWFNNTKVLKTPRYRVTPLRTTNECSQQEGLVMTVETVEVDYRNMDNSFHAPWSSITALAFVPEHDVFPPPEVWLDDATKVEWQSTRVSGVWKWSPPVPGVEFVLTGSNHSIKYTHPVFGTAGEYGMVFHGTRGTLVFEAKFKVPGSILRPHLKHHKSVGHWVAGGAPEVFLPPNAVEYTTCSQFHLWEDLAWRGISWRLCSPGDVDGVSDGPFSDFVLKGRHEHSGPRLIVTKDVMLAMMAGVFGKVVDPVDDGLGLMFTFALGSMTSWKDGDGAEETKGLEDGDGDDDDESSDVYHETD
jgi:hypothetical protein